MPIYDYQCQDCKEIFELLILKQSDPPQCPGCQSHNLEQQISTFRVDSASTRESSMKVAKAKNAKMQKDYAMAQLAYEKEHRH